MSGRRLIGAARALAVAEVKASIRAAVAREVVTLRQAYSAEQTVKLVHTATRELLAETAAQSGDGSLTRALLEEWR